ncbi:MAG: hypothetical protein H5T63_08640, partial [Chloroflexi bacterium]|nr:hypothetical protein [Chloroflexota bacterium]
MEKQPLIRLVVATAIFLFFIQAVRVLFSVLFGVIYDAIFAGPLTAYAIVANLLVLLAFLTPLFVARAPSRRLPLLAAWLVSLARVPLTLDDPQIRLATSLLIVAAGGLHTVSLLQENPGIFPWAWFVALAIDQVLRAAGNTFDITLQAWWLPVQGLLSGALFFLSFFTHRLLRKETPLAGLGLLGGLAIGAFLFLETSLLALPHAIARWSAWSYAALTPLLLLITLLPLLYGVHGSLHPWRGRSRTWGVFFLFFACVGLAVGHLAKGLPAAIALLLMQWVVLVSFPSVLREPKRGEEWMSLHLALGFLFFLL